MIRRFALLALAFALPVLAACSELKTTLGIQRKGPDEFTVVAKAPLILPPDFSLRPPEPGALRPQETNTTALAASALTGRQAPTFAEQARAQNAGASRGEVAMLRQAGADNVDPNIRQTIREEATLLAERDKNFTDKLLFWKVDDKNQELDADAEARRLREAAAAGQPATAGESTLVQRRRRGLLDVFKD